MDFQNTGMSIMEHSHRGKAYDAVHQEALQLVRELLSVPQTHEVFVVQGGASGMFATVPMNFLHPEQSADYVITGAWSQKAYAEAQLLGQARVAATGAVEGAFTSIPGSFDFSAKAAYVHLTSNNTISGTQFSSFPQTPAPLVVDMSSDILSRRLDISQFGLIYAGAQKNVGPSGVVLGIINKEWMEQARTDIPKIFRYKTHVDKNSLYHTPPTFGIYLMRNVLLWLKGLGGLEAVEKRNDEKANLLYGAIDSSEGFYRSTVDERARSKMNVVFRLSSEDQEAKFIAQATDAGLIGLKGHRSVGGVRASTYNAVSVEGVQRLVEFMASFQRAS